MNACDANLYKSFMPGCQIATLIDTIQSNGGVVIVAANCSEETLQSRLGDEIGPALVRRLIGPRMNPDKLDKPTSPDRCGILVDFEAGSIHYGHKLVQVHLKRRGGHAHEDGKDKTDKTGKSRDLDVTDDEGAGDPTYLTMEDAVAGNRGTSKGAKVQVTPHK